MLVGGELWGSREEGWGEGDEGGGLDTAMNLPEPVGKTVVS